MWYYLAVVGLCLGNFLLHKPISDVCDAIRARTGFALYDRGALVAFSVLSTLAVAPIATRRRAHLSEPTTFFVLLVLAALTVAAQHWLLVTNIELIHFPQFALIAGLLWAGGMAPQAAWLGGTACGILDEFYQHLVIYAGRPDTYLDYNDMVLNAMGAAWIIVLLGARLDAGATPPIGERPRRRRWPLVAIIAAALLGWWIDPPNLDALLRPAVGGHMYHVLSLGEAAIVAGALWELVALGTTPSPVPID